MDVWKHGCYNEIFTPLGAALIEKVEITVRRKGDHSSEMETFFEEFKKPRRGFADLLGDPSFEVSSPQS